MDQAKPNLIILDLDHTLIYGSYAQSEPAKLLFEFSRYLKVYERPFVREFVKTCQHLGEIIVFTTAVSSYAREICSQLDIEPLYIYSRESCKIIRDEYRKIVKNEWYERFATIVIVDDSPQVWTNVNEGVICLVPTEFRGEKEDSDLVRIAQLLLKSIKNKI